MLGRTLLQPATPITFGLKVAGWTSAITHSWRRLHDAWSHSLVIQFGGAAGTLAALDGQGLRVLAETARELDLRAAPPWHTNRDRLGALVTACGLYVAALGKAARDITLLMQAEVGEAAEPGGGSSTMPHKQNPARCTVVLAAATRMPALVAAYLTGDDPGARAQHRRQPGRVANRRRGSTGDWSGGERACRRRSRDCPSIRRECGGTSRPLAAPSSHERAVVRLAPLLGRDNAQRLVAEAVEESRRSGAAFAGVLQASLGDSVPGDLLAGIDRPEALPRAPPSTLRTWLLNDPEE